MITSREQIESAEKNLALLKANQAKEGAMSPTPCGPCESQNVLRLLQVHQELEELGYAVESLEKAIAVLHDRLSMVTRPSTTCAGGPQEGNKPKVPLSSIISENRRKVRQFQAIITELTDRLEI